MANWKILRSRCVEPHYIISAITGLLCLQVQEVVGVMRNNIDKVLERDSKLNDLDYRQTDLEFRFRKGKIFPRASNLQATSAVFQQSSRRLRKKYWWQ